MYHMCDQCMYHILRLILLRWMGCGIHKCETTPTFMTCLCVCVRVYRVHRGNLITEMQYTLCYIFAQISRERGKKIIIQNIKLVRHMCIKNITYVHKKHHICTSKPSKVRHIYRSSTLYFMCSDTSTVHQPCTICVPTYVHQNHQR